MIGGNEKKGPGDIFPPKSKPTGENRNQGDSMTRSPRSEITADNIKDKIRGKRAPYLDFIKDGGKIYGSELKDRTSQMPEDITEVNPELVGSREEGKELYEENEPEN